MRSFWVDPYLWIHLAGIAAVPIFFEFCLLGLSIGEPLFPAWLELLLVGGIGILPIVWMQWQRPFSIFSLLVLALKPTQLTEDQRRILSLFKSPVNRVLAVLVAVAMSWILWQLYQLAPVVSPNLFPGIGRGTALLIAALSFFGANLFLQIPISVLGILWTSNRQFAATEPYPVEQIRQGFTIPGIRVEAIVPPLFSEPVKPKAPPAPPAPPTVQPAPAIELPSPSPATTASDEPIAPVAEPSAMQTDELEDEFESELEDEAESVTSADAETPPLYPTTHSPLLQESEPFRLVGNAEVMEEVPIAESVVERIVSQEDTLTNTDTAPESAVEPAPAPEPDEIDRSQDTVDDLTIASSEDNLTEPVDPQPVEIIEDATVAETIEGEPDKD